MSQRIMQGPFGQVQTRAILDPALSDRAVRILALMCSHAYRGRQVDPKLRERDLAEELGITQQAIAKHIKALADRGYIERERGGYPAHNLYRIIWDQPDIPEEINRTPEPTPANITVTTPEVVTEGAPVTTLMGCNQLQPIRVVTSTTPEVVTVPIGTQIKTEEETEWPDPHKKIEWTAINRWARSRVGRLWMMRCKFDPDGYSQSNKLTAYSTWWEARQRRAEG